MFFDCPRCSGKLVTAYLGNTRVFRCTGCSGMVLLSSAMHLRSGRALLAALYDQAQRIQRPSQLVCSSCRKPMRAVSAKHEGRSVDLDVCISCHLFWLDRGELESLPGKDFETIAKDQARDALKPQDPTKFPSIDAIFGEKPRSPGATPQALEDSPPMSGFPALTIAFCVAAVVLFFKAADWRFAANLSFQRLDPWRIHGLNWLSYALIHDGKQAHALAFNLYFIAVFGAHLERVLRAWELLALMVLSAIGGAGMYVLLGKGLLLSGASAVVTGAIAYFATEFPYARLKLPAWQAKMLRTYPPVIVYVLTWIGVQAYLGLPLAKSAGLGVYAPQIGGALAGFAFWLVRRPSARRPVLS